MQTTATTNVASFSIDKKEGQKLMGILGSVVNMNTILPILEDVLIIVSKEKVEFIATNLDCAIKVDVPVISWQGEFSACVPFGCLRWFFNKALGDTVVLSFKEDKCFMKSEDAVISVLCDKSEEFPVFPEESIPVYKSNFQAKDIIPTLRPALGFVSNDDLRPSMTGVQLRNYAGGLYVCATDAHKAYYKSILNYDGNIDCVLGRRFVEILCNHFAKKDFELRITENHAIAEANNIILVSRLIQSRFPDWTRVLPKTNYEILFNRKEIMRRIDLVSFFSNKSTNQIKLVIDQKTIKIYGGDIDFITNASAEIPVESFTGLHAKESLIFGVNSRFFMEALRVNLKDESVSLKMVGTVTGAMIIDDCALVMPLLLNEI
jgi:DNA polymerase-3 subunit beta